MPQNIANAGPSGPPTALAGLTANGVPLINSGGAPFFTGRWIFCDGINGSDGNSGTADSPVQTLTQAYSLTTNGNNDVVVMVGNGGTSATQRLSATLTWANNATHLIGMTAPSLNQRARISTPTTATVNINPLMTISGSGCYFGNFSFFQGVGQASTDEKLIDISGSRNVFDTIDFGGLGHANGAARAGSYIINLTGGENRFIGGTVGLETVQRSAANASVFVGSGAQRNQFLGTVFMMAASATSPLYVDATTSNCLNGSSMLFQGCLFQNLTGISAASNPAVAVKVATAINGLILLDRCTTNSTKWCAATTQVIVSGFAIGNGFNSGVFATAADS